MRSTEQRAPVRAAFLQNHSNFSPFPDADYIAFTRCFLSLPPRTTFNNATVQPNFDYPVKAA